MKIFYLLFGFMVFANQSEAKVVYYSSSAMQVRIKHGGPTIFRFPKQVQTITGASRLEIKPANENDPTYKDLSVTPRFTSGVNDVVFFLTDGSLVKAKIIVNANDPAADSVYDFKPEGAPETGENAPVLTEVELLKAMIRDDEVSGYKLSRTSESFPSKIDGANIELIRIYKGSPFNGFVFKVTSRREIVNVDVRKLTVGEPNLAILSQSDEAVLYPKGKGVSETILRIVAKNTASSRDVVVSLEPDAPHN